MDRAAAEWVLSVGGEVMVTPEAEGAGRERLYSKIDDLPTGELSLTAVYLVELPRELVATDFARLAGLRHLHTFVFGGNSRNFGEVGATHLKHLEASPLTTLHLPHLRVEYTAEDHQQIAKFTELRELRLDGSVGLDVGLLGPLGKLETLGLYGVPLTEKDARRLLAFPKLKLLSVASTGLSDAAMESVSKLSDLETLRPAGTQVTDAGLADLAPLQKLVRLDVARTKVTVGGVERLSRARPTCSIEFDAEGKLSTMKGGKIVGQ